MDTLVAAVKAVTAEPTLLVAMLGMGVAEPTVATTLRR
jgi:hypothetical protein